MSGAFGRIALVTGLLVLALVVWCALRAAFCPVDELAHHAPQSTALMRQREAEARRRGRPFHVYQRWVPYGHVSPLLRRAVLVAEDDAFFSHGGLDWNELQAAARKNLEKRRIIRGGSTITQQLAKNLFTGDGRTPTRKLTELFVAFRLERALSKRRIFELYLNLIEWGEGIFGAEAASRHYFGVSAADLSPRQAALLGAVIINPRRYSALHPPKRIQNRVRLIASRLRRRGAVTEDQYLAMIGAPPKPSFFDWLFGRNREEPVDTTVRAPEEEPAPLPPPEEPTEPAVPDTQSVGSPLLP